MSNEVCNKCKGTGVMEVHDLPQHEGATLYRWVKPKKVPCDKCCTRKTIVGL